MKTLIVEDCFTSRVILQEIMREHGPVHIAVNGIEAVAAVETALEADEHYDLICLDILMPEKDGQAALREIRSLETTRGINSTRGAKIVMTTALRDIENLASAFGSLCDAYLAKPLEKAKLLDQLRDLGLVS